MTGSQNGNSDDVFTEINKLLGSLDNLDERGLILTLASFAEEALGELVESFLIESQTANILLNGFNAPLGTFSARIKIAYSLGLITSEQFDDFELLRKIRNEFAHTWDHVEFGNQKISPLIAKLSFAALDDVYPDTSMRKVRATLSQRLIELKAITSQVRLKHKQAKRIGFELISGIPGKPDDQIALCKKRLAEIREELLLAKGEKQRFLRETHRRWMSKLQLVANNASAECRPEIERIQLEFGDL